MMNNSLVVTRATDESLSSSEVLDYSRIFEIPQVLPEVITGWIARAVGLASEHTRRNYRADIADFEAWRKGRQVTRGLVEEYLQFRGGAGADHELSPTYRRRILAALRWWIRCIREQVQETQIQSTLWPWKYELLSQLDLAAHVKGPRGQRKEAARAGRHLTDEEALSLLETCLRDPDEKHGVRDLAMIAVAIAAGPRVHETVGIALADVSEERDANGLAYRINVIGKGDKQGDLLIVGIAAQYLKRWLDLRGNEPGGVFCPINQWGRFRKIRGGEALKAMTTEAARLILTERCAQAGITKRTTWHDFRRTLIGNLIRQDIGIAQRTARHANVTMTAKYDRRPDEEAKEALRKELNRLEQSGAHR
jgi:site-specific recombinase XerD